jgi:molybdate transport system substrate-binding protein
MLVLLLATAACAQSAAGRSTAPRSTALRSATATVDTVITGDVTVFAAASLIDGFEQIGQIFEARHPDATVRFNFAGSQRLAAQIVEGAPADVFASADGRQMGAVEVATSPVTFAGNVLQIVVEPGNPHGVTGLDDLADRDITLVLAAEEVPAGRYARQALDAAGVMVAPVSLETDVRAVLSKVALGEADAGIVYASDVAAAGDTVAGIAIARDRNPAAAYPAAVLEGAPNPAGGRAFLDLLTTPEGRRVLRDAGFSTP